MKKSLISLALAGVFASAAQAQTQVAEPFRAYYDQHDGIRVLVETRIFAPNILLQ